MMIIIIIVRIFTPQSSGGAALSACKPWGIKASVYFNRLLISRQVILTSQPSPKSYSYIMLLPFFLNNFSNLVYD